MFIDTMYKAYLECVYFTDTGDTSQPSSNAELTPLFKAQAWAACQNFVRAASYYGEKDVYDLDPVQVGHDLWFTRNGHGVGFWDRPRIYGSAKAGLFTQLAMAQGEHDSDFEPEREAKEVPDYPACPKCGCTRFEMDVSQRIKVEFDPEEVPDGEPHDVYDGPYGDMVWDDDTDVCCNDCGHVGPLWKMVGLPQTA